MLVYSFTGKGFAPNEEPLYPPWKWLSFASKSTPGVFKGHQIKALTLGFALPVYCTRQGMVLSWRCMLDCLGNIGTEKNTIRISDVFLSEHLNVFECTYIFIYVYIHQFSASYGTVSRVFPRSYLFCHLGSARFIKENELNESAAARLRGATKEVGLKWRWKW